MFYVKDILVQNLTQIVIHFMRINAKRFLV